MNNQNTPAQAKEPREPEEEAAIERLRKQKAEAKNEAEANGTEAGKTWAVEDAHYKDLVRLKKWWSEYQTPLGGELTLYDIEQTMGLDNGDLEWIREHYEDWIDNEVWVSAFVDGALEKFSELEKNL
jgi:hypothetical protein